MAVWSTVAIINFFAPLADRHTHMLIANQHLTFLHWPHTNESSLPLPAVHCCAWVCICFIYSEEETQFLTVNHRWRFTWTLLRRTGGFGESESNDCVQKRRTEALKWWWEVTLCLIAWLPGTAQHWERIKDKASNFLLFVTAGGRDTDRNDSRETARFPSSLVECVHACMPLLVCVSECVCVCLAVRVCFHACNISMFTYMSIQ